MCSSDLTLLVLFVAEVYSDVLGDPSPDTLRRRLARAINRRWAVLEPLIPLGIPLLIGGAGLISVDAAVWAALGVAVAFLAIWGGITARQRGRSWPRVAGAALVSALIGVIIIVLKAWH